MARQFRWSDVLCDCVGVPRRRASPGRCLDMRDRPVHHPDLAIYSQSEEIAEGRAPSWESPDIDTNHWAPFRLIEAPTVRVRNLSEKSFAANTLVHLHRSRFGIGTEKHYLATQRVSILARGEVTLAFPLDAETLEGEQRLGLHVVIAHPKDTNRINNEGAQVIDGRATSEAGRRFEVSFPVRNPDPIRTIPIGLEVSTGAVAATVDWDTAPLAPGADRTATLDLTVPGHLHGAPDAPHFELVTVVGRAPGGTVIGGVTFIARIDD